MSAMAALAFVSWVALNVGFVGTLVLLRRHIQRARRCHFCRLHAPAPDSLWCSAVCADAEIGVLGKEATL